MLCLLTTVLEVDDRANLGAESFLHTLHHRIGESTAARAGSVAPSVRRACNGGHRFELCATALHLEPQRLTRSLRQRILNDTLRSLAQSHVNQYLRQPDF